MDLVDSAAENCQRDDDDMRIQETPSAHVYGGADSSSSSSSSCSPTVLLKKRYAWTTNMFLH